MTDPMPHPLLRARLTDDPPLTRKELAARWQCSPSHLEKRLPEDMPPRCNVLPGQVRYRLSDVLLFEASRVDPQHLPQPPADSHGPGSRPERRQAGPLPAYPGFPIRLPVTAAPKPRRGGRPPKPALPDGGSD